MHSELTLFARIRKYLMTNTARWVPSQEIHGLARKAGYSYEDIRDTLDEIEGKCLDVGVHFCSGTDRLGEWAERKRGMYYRGYIMSPVQLNEHRARLAWFDEL